MHSSTSMTPAELLATDGQLLCHPYAPPLGDARQPPLLVSHAKGALFTLTDGRTLIDGIASWWCVCHGHNHPALNSAILEQMQQVSHVMFAGLTHVPAIELAKDLVHLTPEGLEHVFFSDSGSVSVEVGCKIALQYWRAKGQTRKTKFLALEHGYHGDTFGTMALCDPEKSMHSPFSSLLIQHHFVTSPATSSLEQAIADLEAHLKQHQDKLAGFILEPLLQGAGGMLTYDSDYLKAARALCTKYGVLMMVDEIATGFGRTGHLFACDAAGISPDLMMLGKALTGGHLSLAATLFTHEIAVAIGQSDAPAIMHGPTFMANPLACAVARASVALFKTGEWKMQVADLEKHFTEQLSELVRHPHIKEVRVLGAMAAIEFHQPIDLPAMRLACVERGVWLRPFGKVLYATPPFMIGEDALTKITEVMREISQTTDWLLDSKKQKGTDPPIC